MPTIPPSGSGSILAYAGYARFLLPMLRFKVALEQCRAPTILARKGVQVCSHFPLCRPMGKGLREVRTDLHGNRTARVLICVSGLSGGAARIHKENTGNTRGRFSAGAQ